MYKGQSLFTIMYVLPIFIFNVFIWVLWLLWWLQRKERCSCRPYSTLRVSCGRGINVRETEGAINNGKSREIGNFVHTRHRKKTNKTKNNNTICVGHHSTQRKFRGVYDYQAHWVTPLNLPLKINVKYNLEVLYIFFTVFVLHELIIPSLKESSRRYFSQI
jgi:ribosomal protein L13E